MRGVRREARLDHVYRKLGGVPHPITNKSIFPTFRDTLAFAALVGFEEEAQVRLTGDLLELDGRLVNEHPQTMDVVYMIALAHTKDINILRDDNEDNALLIFEEFANGGFRIIEGWLKESPEDLAGDKAILNALRKYGYLRASEEVESVMGEIEF